MEIGGTWQVALWRSYHVGGITYSAETFGKVASNPKCHDHAVFTLQDNRPTACSMTKGRSPSFALNRILRQRTAVCLAARLRHFLPWVESEKQPADESSRIC